MRFKIYQAPVEEKFAFMPYDFAERGVEDFADNWQNHYEMVYEGELDAEMSGNPTYDILEYLFCKFNIEHPEDYKARSLSTSDIVVLANDVFYCDSFGWKEI